MSQRLFARPGLSSAFPILQTSCPDLRDSGGGVRHCRAQVERCKTMRRSRWNEVLPPWNGVNPPFPFAKRGTGHRGWLTGERCFRESSLRGCDCRLFRTRCSYFNAYGGSGEFLGLVSVAGMLISRTQAPMHCSCGGWSISISAWYRASISLIPMRDASSRLIA